MKVVSELSVLRAQRSAWSGKVGFVPTMGNLHEGHLALVSEAQKTCEHIVVSIFVNPMQFGENEDYTTYPRTFEADAGKLKALGVDLLFMPEATTIYPQTPAQHTQVLVPGVSDGLCGVSRPGHFTGVATIVCKLLNMVQPDLAVFGKKDYQQLAVIRKMVSDLALPVKIAGLDTIREADGLAMSSRNGYLSAEQRQQANFLYQLLSTVKAEIKDGEKDFVGLEASAYAKLRQAQFEADYFAVRKQHDLSEADENTQDFVLLVAAKLGDTRLIDNLEVTI